MVWSEREDGAIVPQAKQYYACGSDKSVPPTRSHNTLRHDAGSDRLGDLRCLLSNRAPISESTLRPIAAIISWKKQRRICSSMLILA